jgi:RND family efflux transporter MFP subunit
VTRKFGAIWIALSVVQTVFGAAGAASLAAEEIVVLRHCEIEFKRSSLVGVAHMGTSMTTVVQDCFVRLGDRVKAGQVLGRIMDRDIQAELAFRTAESENNIDIRVSEARSELATNKLRRSESLQKRSSSYVSVEEMKGQELEALAAQLQVEQSKHQRRLSEIKRREAEAMVHAREYVSPHDGVVIEVLKQQGEAVSVSEPIFRVVDVDYLKVTGYLNLGDYWRVRAGQEVRISPEVDGDELPIENEVFTGRVVFVDRRIDPTNRTCKVIAEVANRDLLLASGLEAKMEILVSELPDGAAKVAGAPVPDLPRHRAGSVSRPGPILRPPSQVPPGP